VTLEKVTGAGNPDAGNVSKIFVAVSKTSSPASTTSADWYYHLIDAKTVISGSEYWADYPGFAVDEEAVYITSNMFRFITDASGGVRLWIVAKGLVDGFYGGGAASVTIHDPYATAGIATTTQPAHVFGAGGVPGGSPGIGTFLVSYDGLSDGTLEYVQVVRVDDPLGAPVFVQEYISVGNIEGPAFPALPDASQLGTATLVEVNDRRALNAVWRSGTLWLTTTIIPNSGADLGQTTAHWFKLSTTAVPGGAITLSDQGNIGGEDIASTTYTFFPAIAVNPTGDVAIGFSASAATIYPGAYFTGRFSTDPPGTTVGSAVLRAGIDYYIRTFGGSRNRWGDYSGACIDPSDDSFWIFNESAKARGTLISGEEGRWRTAFGNLTAAGLPIQLSSATASVVRDNDVEVDWKTVSETNNYGFEVYRRRGETGEWKKLSFIEGHGTTLASQSYTYLDKSVGFGKYSYQIKQVDLDGKWNAYPEMQVLVGVAPDKFSLAQNYPNPFNPSSVIEFAVPKSGYTTLKVYNILGQEVAQLFEGNAEAGVIHSADWEAATMPSGVYFYTLRSAGSTKTKRMLLMK
jgi:hypothetical protein